MTLDMIAGSSYLPNKFIDGLNFWRTDLTNVNSPKLDAASFATLSNQSNDSYGQLIVDKTSASTQIVHGSRIPVSKSQYLEIKFKVRLAVGAAPHARVIGAATTANGTLLSTYAQNGPSVELRSSVEIEVSAIVGPGARDGVDLVWGTDVGGGYFGIEFTGVNGGTILISDMQVTDVSASFLALHSGMVDIRDFGGIGNGTTDCRAAFIAADAAADGRTIFLPEGDFFVSEKLTIKSPLMCTGRITAADTTPIMLVHRYDFETYVHAFKNEQFAFRKAFQALFYYSDHRVLDLRGRRVELTAPLRLKELLPELTRVTYPRSICNGELRAISSTNWNDDVTTSTATYNGNQNKITLTNVVNVSSIAIGSHVYGNGVGREVFVTSKDEAAKTVTLNHSLFNVNGSQEFTFTRYKFIIDFSEVDEVKYFEATDMRFQCGSRASMILLAESGIACKFTHLWVESPKDRGICSYAGGCNGLTVESCNFQSHEWSTDAEDRNTVAISTKKNDMKVRNNRCTYFRHFAVMGGSGHIVMGNHIFQESPNGGDSRTAGIVATGGFAKSLYVGNYIDNSWIELSQEHIVSDLPDVNTFMGYVTITGNIFTLNHATNAENFSWIKFRPFATGVQMVGVDVIGNSFVNYCPTNVNAAETIITSDGNFDWNKTQDVVFSGNSWRSVVRKSESPVYKKVSRSSAAKTWTEDFSDHLPFGGKALGVVSVAGHDNLSSYTLPLSSTTQGNGGQSVKLTFEGATKGAVTVGVVVDNLN